MSFDTAPKHCRHVDSVVQTGKKTDKSLLSFFHPKAEHGKKRDTVAGAFYRALRIGAYGVERRVWSRAADGAEGSLLPGAEDAVARSAIDAAGGAAGSREKSFAKQKL